MTRYRALPLLAALLLASPASPAQAPTPRPQHAAGVAPDGEPGLGTGRKIRDLERFLRSDAGRAHLASWAALERDVGVLISLAAEGERASGYHELLPGREQTTEAVRAAFRDRATRADAILRKGTSDRALFARMLADARFRARLGVLEGLEAERADLRRGLALFSAELAGFAALSDLEADAAARRVDLAAARLRAAKLDLEALRERRGEDPWKQDAEELVALARDPAREADLLGQIARCADRAERLAAGLFTRRNAKELEPAIAEREGRKARAASVLAEVRTLLPETADREQVSREVAAMPKHRRCELATWRALEGLAEDPLSEDLEWCAGAAKDFLRGALESRAYFDRYLALRGIRAHEHATLKGRELTKEERRALEVVQSGGLGIPR